MYSCILYFIKYYKSACIYSTLAAWFPINGLWFLFLAFSYRQNTVRNYTMFHYKANTIYSFWPRRISSLYNGSLLCKIAHEYTYTQIYISTPALWIFLVMALFLARISLKWLTFFPDTFWKIIGKRKVGNDEVSFMFVS